MNPPYNESDVNELYRIIGESVWHLQHLENILASYVTLRKLQKKRNVGVSIGQSDLELAQNKERRKTLGPLISEAKKEECIPIELCSKFEDMLIERNWLIHKCVINEYLSLRNNDDKNNLFTKITNFSNVCIDLQNEINILFEKWFISKGYDLKSAYTLAERQLKEAERD